MWHNALFTVGVGTILVGLAAAAAAVPSLDAAWRHLFDVLRLAPWGATQLDATARQLSGISGGLMVGYGVTIVLVARRAGAHRALRLGVVSWFVVDSASSVAAGLPANVVLNAVFLVAIVAPLWRIERDKARLP